MKVILTEDIKDLGHKYDVKDVADGYARNFLFPNKLARSATREAVKELEILRSKISKDEADIKKHLEVLARKISGTKLEFTLKSDESGSVFGSVNKESILKALRENGLVTKERVDLKIDHPFKEIGSHKITVDLKKGITAELEIIIRTQG